MAEYKIVIPTTNGTTTGGFSAGGTNTNFVVDRGVSRTPKFRVLKQKFGDGYEQRLLDGINAKTEEYSVSFQNREPTEVYSIADFLDATVPANFDFYIDNEIVKVYCDEYQLTHDSTIGHSLTATFKRVYEA
jgi:phage-related protein